MLLQIGQVQVDVRQKQGVRRKVVEVLSSVLFKLTKFIRIGLAEPTFQMCRGRYKKLVPTNIEMYKKLVKYSL